MIKIFKFVNNFDMDKMFFPLSNGVVVQQDDKSVISVTNCDGNKKMKSYRTKNKVVFWQFPFFRGIQYFFCGIYAFLQSLLMAVDLCKPQVIKKGEFEKFYKKKLFQYIAIIVFSIVFGALFLGMLPAKLGLWIVGYQQSEILRNFVIMLFKVTLLYIFLACLRAFPMMNELFRFNRAGQILFSKNDKQKRKTNVVKNQKSVKKQQKISKKVKKTCNFEFKSTNFLNFVVFVFLLDFVVITLFGAGYGFWFNLALHICISVLCAAVGYEILWLSESWQPLKVLQKLTSFLVYAKPSKTHIETVSVALTEITLLTATKDREFMEDENKKAFSLVYNEVRNKLLSAGVTDKSDADWLIATILEKNRAEIKLVPYVTDKQYEDIIKATERRAKGESLDNIFGWTEFYGIRFDVNKKVLTPRMETELLVEQVLNAQKNFKKPTILDIGTGSGAIAIAVAKNCDAQVTAVDVSKSALAVAQSNAKKNDAKIEFLHSNLFDNLKRKRKFDIIVSNPPYIPSKDIAHLDKNVRECDPLLALDGGEDGLDFYREISSQAKNRLNSNGMIFYEVGKGQAPAVRKILKENGFEDIKTIKDYNKIERIVCGKLR